MKVLTTSAEAQTLKVIPRVYTNSVTIMLRDDSTNDEVSFILPTCEIKGDYLDLSTIFSLKEGRFYDLKIYEIRGSYKEFKNRVISLGGTFTNNTCLLSFLQAQDLVNQSELDVIYKDKIFCTDQTINQNTNSYYSVNKNTYINAPSDNDYIIS